jgi:hypothetical protein
MFVLNGCEAIYNNDSSGCILSFVQLMLDENLVWRAFSNGILFFHASILISLSSNSHTKESKCAASSSDVLCSNRLSKSRLRLGTVSLVLWDFRFLFLPFSQKLNRSTQKRRTATLSVHYRRPLLLAFLRWQRESSVEQCFVCGGWRAVRGSASFFGDSTLQYLINKNVLWSNWYFMETALTSTQRSTPWRTKGKETKPNFIVPQLNHMVSWSDTCALGPMASTVMVKCELLGVSHFLSKPIDLWALFGGSHVFLVPGLMLPLQCDMSSANFPGIINGVQD